MLSKHASKFERIHSCRRPYLDYKLVNNFFLINRNDGKISIFLLKKQNKKKKKTENRDKFFGSNKTPGFLESKSKHAKKKKKKKKKKEKEKF